MAFDDWGSRPYIPKNTQTTSNRLDFRRGRFTVDYETNQINAALRGQQTVNGDYIDYYRFDRQASTVDDLYDEGSGSGRVYVGPIDLPCLHVQHFSGGREEETGGLYYTDTLHVTLSMDSMTKRGLVDIDTDHQRYLLDRVVYNEKVFKVTKIDVLGQIQRRDIIASIDAEQVRSDELVGDPQFERFSA